MKKVSMIIYILVCAVGIFAQNNSQTLPNWETYTSPKDGFSMETPDKIIEYFQTKKNQNGEEVYLAANYSLKFSGTSYFIFSEVLPNTDNKKYLFPTDALKVFILENKAKAESAKIGKFIGERYDFKDSEGFFHKIIFIKTEQRNYIFQTFGENPADTEADRFLNSIKLQKDEKSSLKKPQKVIKTVTSKQDSATGKNDKYGNPNSRNTIASDSNGGSGVGTGRGQGSGNGAGIGSGSGTGSGNPNNTPIQNPIPEPLPIISFLKILSKPKASYTDLARIYQIMGSINVRVTFLANGTIGTTTPISKLPFGLTNNAINAARQIRFEPPTKDGVAYTVTRQVQYTFTLY